jgi:acyl-CoA thioesterase-1
MATFKGYRVRVAGASFAAGLALFASCTRYADRYPAATVRVVAFGDSITFGATGGVREDQTFVSLAETELRSSGLDVGIRNAGIKGQNTDEAMPRYDADVVEARPQVVLIMFGSNDSFVDDGKTEGRVSIEGYRHNLETMIERARAAGIRPILMTPPRWGPRPVNGLRESPNPRLEIYVKVCGDLARERKVPLVDHFADWKAAEKQGQALSAWLVDGLHPNAAGHARMAALLLPVLRHELEAGKAP